MFDMQFILLAIFLISLSLNCKPSAGYGQDPEYDDQEPNVSSRADKYEQKIARLEDEIEMKDDYIAKLEHRIDSLRRQLRQRGDRHRDGYRRGDKIKNYASAPKAASKLHYPHDSNDELTNDDMMSKIVPKVSARMPEAGCMSSCNLMKNSKVASDPLSQYMYLMVCAEGCRKSIPCLNDNYCLPVMKENPDFFVQCVGKCESIWLSYVETRTWSFVNVLDFIFV